MNTDTVSALAEGRQIVTVGGAKDAADLPWNPHPAFEGVSLKHLVTGADTDGALSCHLVRVAPGKTLKSHIHEGQWELHEVVSGEGVAGIDGAATRYSPGVVAVIPKGLAHEVTAGDAGLCLFAKFFPALL
ncbi:cupin domain-containing protein [Desulfovibrio sp. JY]|nr:cupin domain-containing protein [Desulfovibrio sp. JY]